MVSFGVGKGHLEWNLKNIDDSVMICCSDFTKETLDRLKELFPRCDDFVQFDLKTEDYSIFADYKTAIMYRICDELDKKTWKNIFRKCWFARINTIVFVAGYPATIRSMINNYYEHFKNKFLREGDVFASYRYFQNEYKKMWGNYYSVRESEQIGAGKMYILSRNGKGV